MLEEILQYLNNWFVAEMRNDIYVIKGNSIVLPFLSDGQYFRIAGSILNDGVHQYPANDLKDETFSGVIWALAIPNAILNIVDEIVVWTAKNGDFSPYTSESFGGYSYSKAINSRGVAVSWQDVFAARLSPWKKLGRSYQYAQPNPHMTPSLTHEDNLWRW